MLSKTQFTKLDRNMKIITSNQYPDHSQEALESISWTDEIRNASKVSRHNDQQTIESTKKYQV